LRGTCESRGKARFVHVIFLEIANGAIIGDRNRNRSPFDPGNAET
jgi:hypothetical protein